MKIEHIVATMNRKDIKFLNDNNYTIDSIIINQTNEEKKETYYLNDRKIDMYSYNERGLSKSRNRGISHSNADICIISDDDVEYATNLKEIIENAYNENLEYDIIVFQVKKNENELYKNYYKEKKIVKFIDAMKVSSVEMTFKRESFEKYGIEFNESFGAGAEFLMGEENILLALALKKGLKILYVPTVIGTLTESESTWFTGYNKRYFISKGASFTEINSRISWLLIIQFALRKYKLYKQQTTLKNGLIYMFEGRRKILKKNKRKQI